MSVLKSAWLNDRLGNILLPKTLISNVEDTDGQGLDAVLAHKDAVIGCDAYTSSKTYAVGDLVIYDNKLWRCLVANSATPSEGANWTLTSIAKEIPKFSLSGTTLTIEER